MDADPFSGECVYTELVAIKERLLDELGAQRDKVHREGRLEVQHDDAVLRREHMRLKRLDYWSNEKRLKDSGTDP